MHKVNLIYSWVQFFRIKYTPYTIQNEKPKGFNAMKKKRIEMHKVS